MFFPRVKPLPPPNTTATVTVTYTIVDDERYIALWRWWIGHISDPSTYLDDSPPGATASVFGAVIDSESITP